MNNAEHYTFESFILDLESNYCAPKICIAACDQPMTAFPLILYGANGCGKTHLLLAMRNYVEGKTNSKTKIVSYLSCKDLIDDLVYCLDQNGNSDDFYKKYLSYDVLLIDNCHYLAGRKATQKEILRLVKKFYMRGKTLALAFDGAIENYDYIISKIKANYQNFALVKIGMPSDALKTAYIKKLCNKMDVTFTKGRYSGKYALSELLVCGCCTGHYRRKTVKKKDGVMHYWRCSSRLEHADKYCSNSIGLEEEAVKDAVCRALSRVLKRREKGYEVVNSHLIYAASADERSEDMYFIDKGIRDEEQRIMDLSKLARESGNNQEKFEAAIADCTKRIKILREKKEQVIRQLNFNEEAKKEMDRIKSYLAEDRAVVDKFDDSTVRRLVNQIVVSEDLKLTIYIKGGYEIEEQYLPRPKSA